MPLKKIETINLNWEEPICSDPEHNPPTMIVLEPGSYEYTCPTCGRLVFFTVPRIGMLK